MDSFLKQMIICENPVILRMQQTNMFIPFFVQALEITLYRKICHLIKKLQKTAVRGGR